MNETLVDELIKLVVALIVGAVIGAEREYKSKSAGFRTVILITIGSTIFTIVSNQISSDGRLAANIVTGIGFLGAGAIFREGINVKGLTTATTIWVASTIGMAIGIGKYEFVLASLIMVMLVLLSFTWIQKLIEKKNKVETYHITIDANLKQNHQSNLDELFKQSGLRASRVKSKKINHKRKLEYLAYGPSINHIEFVKTLFETSYIVEFET